MTTPFTTPMSTPGRDRYVRNPRKRWDPGFGSPLPSPPGEDRPAVPL
jgi:hypothetical protein